MMSILYSGSSLAWTSVPLDGLNHDQKKIVEYNAQQAQKEEIMTQNAQQPKHATSRRSFLRKGLAVGGAGAIGAGLLANGLSLPAFAEESSSRRTGRRRAS